MATDAEVILRLDELGGKVDRLRESVDEERAARERQIAAWDKRIEASDKASTTARRAARRSIAAVVVVAVVVFFVWRSNSDSQARNDRQSFDRRVADCHSLEDIGAAIKAGAAVVQNPAATPEQQGRIDEFIANYDAAVDKAIATVKKRKGYSADCTQIGAPPSSSSNGG